MPTPDPTTQAIIAAVRGSSQPASTAYASPDGAWRVVLANFACTPVGEQDIYAYETVSLVATDGAAAVVDSQLINCGGLGAYGFDGLFWSADSRYFYYTTAPRRRRTRRLAGAAPGAVSTNAINGKGFTLRPAWRRSRQVGQKVQSRGYRLCCQPTTDHSCIEITLPRQRGPVQRVARRVRRVDRTVGGRETGQVGEMAKHVQRQQRHPRGWWLPAPPRAPQDAPARRRKSGSRQANGAARRRWRSGDGRTPADHRAAARSAQSDRPPLPCPPARSRQASCSG
jgi:hypothetical protein